jgi:hypothetical protein
MKGACVTGGFGLCGGSHFSHGKQKRYCVKAGYLFTILDLSLETRYHIHKKQWSLWSYARPQIRNNAQLSLASSSKILRLSNKFGPLSNETGPVPTVWCHVPGFSPSNPAFLK